MLAWSLASAACFVLSALPVATTASPPGGSPAATRQNSAEKEKEKDPVYEEGYADGFEEGKSFGKAGGMPGGIILPSGLIKIMIQRLGLSKYRRWEQGYLKGHRDGYAAGRAAYEAAKRPRDRARQKTPRKPAPEGFGPLKLGMKRTEAHAAISSWDLRYRLDGPAYGHWEGVPIRDVWRFGVLFSDGFDLRAVTDSNGEYRLGRPEDIPADYRDACLIKIVVNYLNDYLPARNVEATRRALSERIRGLYGAFDAPGIEEGTWLWPKEDRYVYWHDMLSLLTIGMGIFARQAVQTAIEETETAWQHEQSAQAAAGLDDALRGTPERKGVPAESAAPSTDRDDTTAEAMCGSWRVLGHGSVNGRFEGSLVLERSDRPSVVTGELVWLEGRVKELPHRTRVHGTLHVFSGALSRGLNPGTVLGEPLRVLILRTEESPGGDARNRHPPVLYAAALETDNELRWGTTSWASEKKTFSWEATRVQEGKADEGLPPRPPNGDPQVDPPAPQAENPAAPHLRDAQARLTAGDFRGAGEVANIAIAAAPEADEPYGARAGIFHAYGVHLADVVRRPREASRYYRLALEDYGRAIARAPDELRKTRWQLARGLTECSLASVGKERPVLERVLAFAQRVAADEKLQPTHHQAWEVAG